MNDALGTTFVIRPVYLGFEVDSAKPELAAARSDYFATWRQERMDGTYQDIWGRAMYGAVFRDGFETGNTAMWTAQVP